MATDAVAAIVPAAGVSAVVYIANDGDDEFGIQVAGPVPAGPQPGATADWKYGNGDIHEARMDLAARLNVDPISIELWQMQGAFWNGCIGVSPRANPGCDDLGVFGHAVDFEADGKLYRYNVGNDRFVAMDWVKDVDIDDGQDYMENGKPMPLPDSSRNFSRAMAMAAGDLELRTGTSRDAWVRVLVDHVTFANGCLGFERSPMVVCRSSEVPGAIVEFERAEEKHRYHVSLEGTVALDFEPGKASISPDPAVLKNTRELREHLAARLSASVSVIPVDDYIDVVWGDSCLGIHYPGGVCTATEIEGYWASFTAEEVQWTYHGTPDGFEVAWPPPDEFTRILTWKRRLD